jgi:hypothetical protein
MASNRVSSEDAFDGAKVPHQSMRQRRADAGKALQQEQPLRREPFRLPVESAQSSLLRPAHLVGEESHQAHRL